MEQQKKANWSKIIIYAAAGLALTTLLDGIFLHSLNLSPNESKEQAIRDSINGIKMLPFEVNSRSQLIDSLLFTNGAVDDASKRLDLIKSVSITYHMSQNPSLEPEIRKKGRALGSKIARLQVKQFPLLRKMYLKSKKDALWEEDIDIQAHGTKIDILVLTGGSLAPNKRKKQFMEAIYETVHKLRFKKVIFKWYEHDEQFTYYAIDSPKDSEIM